MMKIRRDREKAVAQDIPGNVGIRKVEHLQDNTDALKVRLSKKEIKVIEVAYDFKVGFPHDFIGYHRSQN